MSLYFTGCDYLDNTNGRDNVYTQKDSFQLADWPLEDMVVIRNVNSSTKK